MIVEDDLANRQALGTVFSQRGWAICPAHTISEALILLDGGMEPDYLILDLNLPDGDGATVLRKVRQAKLKTRVAVCSGTTDPLQLMHVRDLRPDLLLIKPINPAVLCNVFENELRSHLQ